MTKHFPTISALMEDIEAAWSLESSKSWTPANPAKGQCSVTSLVVQEIFGGGILTTKTTGGTHFYNRINGVRHDLTVSQFANPISFDDTPSSRDHAMADTSPEKLAALRGRLGLSQGAIFYPPAIASYG